MKSHEGLHRGTNSLSLRERARVRGTFLAASRNCKAMTVPLR